ncbi:MOSC domain-containing protein [Yinghuangia sp. ASG 101]|uniref:MOSC domain-containing protein n=1 Tax=Yinghuangia sp. ASG 101 TaxID=2896848 RepID=UPI001E311419|nr:MOSC domain-containing protein [Yinghuangia sp. ASG 101]UGQ15284.1 MOSC domain-containing protein [Yinghuangia sp. ASG 101]
MPGTVVAVSSNAAYTFTKPNRARITLLAGLGVEGDVHAGVTVKHRSRVARDPTQPNLRQVHLMHDELHEELRAAGFPVEPGRLGENITTRGVDLLGLPTGTRLHLGPDAVVEVTGLRNPCGQIDGVKRGLLARVVHRDDDGNVVRRAGIMGIVVSGGDIVPGDAVRVVLPAAPHTPLVPV